MKENMTEKVVETLSPMQQELLNRADSIFETLKQGAIVAKDFAMEQLPDIAMQYIVFNRAYLSFLIILPILFALFVWFSYANWCKAEKKYMGNDFSFPMFFFFITGVVSCIGTVVSFISACIHFKDFLMVWFAPKIFLIQTITEVVSKR